MNNKPRVSVSALILSKSFEVTHEGKQITVIRTSDATAILKRKTLSGKEVEAQVEDEIQQQIKTLNNLLDDNLTKP